MLPANAHPMPVFPPSPPLGRGSIQARISSLVGKFLRRFGRAGKTAIPGLPEDLRADLAIDARREGRVEGFWQAKRRSVGRDLPI